MVKKMFRVNKSLNRTIFSSLDRVELGSLSLLSDEKKKFLMKVIFEKLNPRLLHPPSFIPFHGFALS